jgi:hypothetical protein
MADRRTRRGPRAAVAAFAVLAALSLLAPAAGAAPATKLTIPDAREKAAVFAERTCDRDQSCVRHGVLNCRREAPLVVHCRIFDERSTEVQGIYRCNREIRMVQNRRTHRIPVTGLGRWHC